MPDLIGHPGVHIGVQEWLHEERGRLDPACTGVTLGHERDGFEADLDPRLRGGDVDARLLPCLSALTNHPHRIDGQCH